MVLYLHLHIICILITVTNWLSIYFIFEEDNTTKNYLLFFLKGDFTICCNQFHNKLFHAGEMILIPRSSRLKGFAETDSSLLSMFFDIPAENCDKLILQSLSNVCNNIKYDFSPIKIRYPLTLFLEVLTHFFSITFA